MQPGHSEEVYTGTGAQVRVRRHAPGLLHVAWSGTADGDAYRFVRGVADVDLHDGSTGLTIFYDATGLTGFTREFRKQMMSWQAETRGRQLQVVLLRSRILAAAITAANALTGGGAITTADRRHFDTLLAEAAQSRSFVATDSSVRSRLPRL